jgi:ParB family chromosome partitioning protein
MVRDGSLTMGHARALLGSPDRALQEQLAKRVVAEGLSVRAVEDALRAPAPNGNGGKPSGSTAAPRGLRPPGLLELEGLLGDHLDTRVKVDMSAKRGRITIEFSDLEDLERIYKIITE